jgi:hypothetical protein
LLSFPRVESMVSPEHRIPITAHAIATPLFQSDLASVSFSSAHGPRASLGGRTPKSAFALHVSPTLAGSLDCELFATGKPPTPLKSGKSTFLRKNARVGCHPTCARRLESAASVRTRKSFIYRFYAQSPPKSFIYRIYARHGGWGVIPALFFSLFAPRNEVPWDLRPIATAAGPGVESIPQCTPRTFRWQP